LSLAIFSTSTGSRTSTVATCRGRTPTASTVYDLRRFGQLFADVDGDAGVELRYFDGAIIPVIQAIAGPHVPFEAAASTSATSISSMSSSFLP